MAKSQLSQNLRFLHNAAPEQYEAVINSFTRYINEVILAMTEADQSNILVMQGRAQQCRAIHQILVESAQDEKKPAPQ